ncbi:MULTISPECIES: LacI family DNA-binding transcriptional regulator [unclassified Lonepinella]|uniref:LacI family DNA-binding transcriptional regulator n=1 Tax=unclassified Lonepinella TaxID=2642006 RepID=UPI0036DC0EFA
MPQQKVTIKDVAQLAKVGKTSVSRYLNGEFHVLSDDIQHKISDAIKQLNYQPSQIARSMKGGKTKLIAAVFTDISNPYSIDIMTNIEKSCRDKGYTLLVFNISNKIEQEEDIIQSLLSYRVDGVIIQSLRLNNPLFSKLPMPIVSIDRPIDDFHCDIVALNHVNATQILINHLLDKDFERILFITQNIEESKTRALRAKTFKEYIESQHSNLGEIIEIDDINNIEKIMDYIALFCRKNTNYKKAIITSNGITTLSTLLALKNMNLISGKDIGLAGFDDTPWLSIVEHGITVLKQPTDKIGKKAFDMLFSRINNDMSEYTTILYEGELIVRGSTLTVEE